MVATLTWFGTTAAGDSGWATVTALRFKNANDLTINTANPLVKPSGGSFDYSYEKKLKISVSGTFTSLQNLRLLLDPADTMDTGTNVYFTFNSTSSAAPVEPSAITNYVTLSTTPYTWPGASEITATDESWGDYLYVFMRISDTVAGGLTTTLQMFARYDEI